MALLPFEHLVAVGVVLVQFLECSTSALHHKLLQGGKWLRRRLMACGDVCLGACNSISMNGSASGYGNRREPLLQEHLEGQASGFAAMLTKNERLASGLKNLSELVSSQRKQMEERHQQDLASLQNIEARIASLQLMAATQREVGPHKLWTYDTYDLSGGVWQA